MLFLRSKGQDKGEDKDEHKDQRKVSGSSAQSFGGAIADAVSKARSRPGDISEATVKHMRLAAQGGRVIEYKVELKFDSPSEDEEDDD